MPVLSKLSNQPQLASFKPVFRCLVRGSARGLIQQITVNRSCLLAYDDLCEGIAFFQLYSIHPNHQQFLHLFMELGAEIIANALAGVIPAIDSQPVLAGAYR
ncbi:hypothetical protein AVEN_133861-1 [Araneus ventricosus]|uniref:Uncharacterized protein n=1 Tax=Araneus ventricosus TaxID=182803 RepID=A0A4Y2N8X2_ARAVE|nr:hypothetical protein AVEN_133861-1 [Araneus ventricosus]